jgi:hypothetical protein
MNWGPSLGSTLHSSGYALWNVSQRHLNLQTQGYSMSAGNCETTCLDWATHTAGAHHDIRANRMCYLGATLEFDDWYESSADVGYITGMQKFYVCYGANNTVGSCTKWPASTKPLGSVNPSFVDNVVSHNPITSFWVRTAGNTYVFGTGGDPHSPSN